MLIDTKYSVFFLIRKKNLDQNNSVEIIGLEKQVREIIGSFPMKKKQKNYSKLLNFRKKLKVQLKFTKICNF